MSRRKMDLISFRPCGRNSARASKQAVYRLFRRKAMRLRRKCAHSAASPFQNEPASLGFVLSKQSSPDCTPATATTISRQAWVITSAANGSRRGITCRSSMRICASTSAGLPWSRHCPKPEDLLWRMCPFPSLKSTDPSPGGDTCPSVRQRRQRSSSARKSAVGAKSPT